MLRLPDAGARHTDRIIVDGRDRDEWLAARAGRLGGSDAAGFAKVESVPSYIRTKLHNPFMGNAYTAHGSDREARILRAYGLALNTAMFHAAPGRSRHHLRHVSTPDGVVVSPDGEVVIVEAKTVQAKIRAEGHIPAFTNARGARAIPPNYRRQSQWNMYVLGATRCLFTWEEHDQFQPIGFEPESVVIDRDDAEIGRLILIADAVLDGIDAANQFKKEIQE